MINYTLNVHQNNLFVLLFDKVKMNLRQIQVFSMTYVARTDSWVKQRQHYVKQIFDSYRCYSNVAIVAIAM